MFHTQAILIKFGRSHLLSVAFDHHEVMGQCLATVVDIEHDH